MKLNTKEITHIAILAAIISVLSIITFQINVVPITLSVFAVLLSAVIAGAKKSVTAVAVYILIGALGIPVFSGIKGGVQILAGPTGGYIISYIFMALIVGIVSDKIKENNIKNQVILFLFSIISIAVCYILGTIQYVFITSIGWTAALSACVYPFIPFDIIKSFLAVIIGLKIKTQIKNIM